MFKNGWSHSEFGYGTQKTVACAQLDKVAGDISVGDI